MVEVEYKKYYNTAKFRQAALHFQEFGYYTAAPRGTTEYVEYWDREIDRCLNGFKAEDGDYITGYHYFYLNYCPILLVREVETISPAGNTIMSSIRERDFPDFWDSDKQFFDLVQDAEENGQHLVVLKARGKGYSYKTASMLNRNFFLVEDSKSYAIASEMEFLTKDGILTKAWDMMDFIDEHTAWTKKRQRVDTKMHKRASYITDSDGTKVEVGYKSEIIGITLKNDPQKARGKRGKLILWEEAGKFPGLLAAWQVARPSVEQGGKAYGLMIAFGTGGTEEGDYGSLKELFYKPKAYNCLEVRNIWDTGADNTACGFFVPAYVNMDTDHMDDQGNSLIPEAKRFGLAEREKVEINANDKSSVDRYIAEQPFTPMEATLQLSGNIFPKKDLAVHLARIQTDTSLFNYKQVGDLVFDEGGNLKWVPAKKQRDIVKFPLDRTDDKTGSIVIWEHPPADIPYGLYIGGCLTPGEKVPTRDGSKNVEDITLEDFLINKEGEEVRINTLLRYNKVNEPVYKISMSVVDRPTNYTQEHPLYLSDSLNGEFSFIKARDAKEGMWTKYPNFYNKVKEMPIELWDKYKSKRKNNSANPLLNEDFWWFVGHWLGDGFNNKHGDNYTIYNSFGLEEDEYVRKYKRIVCSLFDRSPNLKLQNGSNTHKFEYKQLYLFLEENFGKYADGKFIAEWVKYIPHRFKQHLILGYLDSDGSVYKDRVMIRAAFKSINRRLLNDIQDLLFSIGIVSSFNLSDKASTYEINGKTGLTKESYALRINQTNLKKLADKFGFDYWSRKLRLAKEIQFKQKPRISDTCIMSEDAKYIYIKINKIEASLYTGTVYNFDCETHTFITQYCTGHNCDPYDHDDSGTGSLGSTFIYKRFQSFEEYYDVIVAEYTGRPETAEEYYENVRRLLLYYNAVLLYENERKGIFPYFISKGCDYLLADQPDIINDIVRDTKVKRRKGVHMVDALKDWGEREIRDWLNEEYAPGRKNLTKILSVPLLQELIAYNDKGNFDRVMALMMIMFYRRELHKVHVKEKQKINRIDPFFSEPLFTRERLLNFNIR